MAGFESRRAARSTSPRAKNAPVFCAGWRVFVHWPPREGGALTPVPLTDTNGRPLTKDLADGQQVEILGWRPRSREGLLYQVRRLSDGGEWWICAQYLRRQCGPEGTEAAVMSNARR